MEESYIEDLKNQIRELGDMVRLLTQKVNELASRMEPSSDGGPGLPRGSAYTLFGGSGNYLGDASWERLLAILRETDFGFTAAELAELWGRSRSRTSEVLNQLVDEGRLVKFRDGRKVRFRAVD